MASVTLDEHVRRLPAERLRPYVAWYTGYRQRGVPPAVHRGLPSPFLTLIFTLDEPLTIMAHPDAAQPPGEFGALLGGLHSAPALIRHQGAQSGIQIALKPAGARALLGLPAGEIAQIDMPAEAVLGAAGPRIHDRVVSAAGWPERFGVLDDAFGALVSSAGSASGVMAPEVTLAWGLLLRSGGTVPVSELAAETGWSGRHLASRFRAEIGLTPKAAARVVRFDRARRRLTSLSAGGGAGAGTCAGYGLADLAVACGYFDQAHLAREFRALAGCPPSQWLAEEFRNVQAGAWLTGEDWA
jgi:AraC-like DNA-binding protein